MKPYGGIQKKKKINRTSDGRNCTRMASMIPLLPADKIPQAWRYILDKYSACQEMKVFRQYFEKQWYPQLSPDILSCANQRHRTTNATEGWHRRLNGRIPKNPAIHYFLYKLRKEAIYCDTRLVNSLFKTARNKRRMRDIIFDKKYNMFLKNLENGKLSLKSFFTKIIFLRLTLFKC